MSTLTAVLARRICFRGRALLQAHNLRGLAYARRASIVLAIPVVFRPARGG